MDNLLKVTIQLPMQHEYAKIYRDQRKEKKREKMKKYRELAKDPNHVKSIYGN